TARGMRRSITMLCCPLVQLGSMLPGHSVSRMMATTVAGEISTAPTPIATMVETSAITSSNSSSAGNRLSSNPAAGRASVACVIALLAEQFGVNGPGEPLEHIDIARRRRAFGIGHEKNVAILDGADILQGRGRRQIV